MSEQPSYFGFFVSTFAKEFRRQNALPWRRRFRSAIAKAMFICAGAMVAISIMGVIIGKAPLGNAIGAAIFSVASIFFWRLANALRPPVAE